MQTVGTPTRPPAESQVPETFLRQVAELLKPAPLPEEGLPWGSWTWRNPTGRLLSAGIGLGALALGAALGGVAGWTYWASLLAPDIALFYDLRNAGPAQGQLSPKAARLYNLLHHPLVPVALVAAGVSTANQPLLVAGLAWGAHVALDRALGYGFRLKDGRRC
jgi:hypothetical protein